jgi:hypothetical protein
VDVQILEVYLRRGLSLEAIGGLTRRDPTTVGYWVKRHGLSAVYRDRHAPKGGIDLETLTALVNEGFSTRQMAERLGLSQSTSDTGSGNTGCVRIGGGTPTRLECAG